MSDIDQPCPNGCGLLVDEDGDGLVCPECRYRYADLDTAHREIDDLRGALGGEKHLRETDNQQWQEKYDRLYTAGGALRAERDRYRTALRQIDIAFRTGCGLPVHIQAYCMRSVAKVALSPEDRDMWRADWCAIAGEYGYQNVGPLCGVDAIADTEEKTLDAELPPVRCSHDKQTRAEPVTGMYEQGRVAINDD